MARGCSNKSAGDSLAYDFFSITVSPARDFVCSFHLLRLDAFGDGCDGGGSGLADLSPRFRRSRHRDGPLVELAEDHLAGGSLQYGRDGDVDVLADHLAGVVYHYHGSVIEIGHALVVLLAFFQDENPNDFAGQHTRL